jgi:hypothetical protein
MMVDLWIYNNTKLGLTAHLANNNRASVAII